MKEFESIVFNGKKEGCKEIKSDCLKYSNIAFDENSVNVSKDELLFHLKTIIDYSPESNKVGFAWNDTFLTNAHDDANEAFLNDISIKKYGLDRLEELFKGADIYIHKGLKLQKQDKCVLDYYLKYDKDHVSNYTYEFIELFRKKCPEYESDINEYLKSKMVILDSIFVLKKELFIEYKELLKTVLVEFVEQNDFSLASYRQMEKVRSYACLILAVFALKKEKQDTSVKRLSKVHFSNVKKEEEWSPAFDSNNVPIVLCASDFYVIYLSAMVTSIVENRSDGYNYDINILHSSIKQSNQDILKKISDGLHNVSIRFYDVSERMAGVDLKASGHISVETYFRLLIPDIFSNCEKILFLDSDMTCHADVAELYNTDVNGYMVAAAHDQCCAAFLNGMDKSFITYCNEKLKLVDNNKYFQAGVMVLNLSALRERYTHEELFEIATCRQYRYVDQDIMNVLCEGKVKFLDLEWDCFPDMGDYEYEYMPYYLQKQYQKARKDPKICHHTGPIKPWNHLFADNMMTYKFWKNAEHSPFFSQILYRTMMSSATEYAIMVNEKKIGVRIKRFIKYRIVVPLTFKMFPRGTKSRKLAIRFYYGLRKKEIPTWEMDD